MWASGQYGISGVDTAILPFRQLKKVKKASGEIIGVNVVRVPALQSCETGFAYVLAFALLCRSMKRNRLRSRTSVSGCAMTPVRARTTCTRNSVSSAVLMLSGLSTKTWPQGTVHASGPST